MKASILTSAKTNKIMEVPRPEITNNQVLIKVKYCGVCASELHPWQQGAIEQEQTILGHEGMGIIEEVGSNVEGFCKGDRVTGLFNQAFAEYAVAEYQDVIKIPDELEGMVAIGEPLSCLWSGANRTPVNLGDTVAVVGLGFMGLGFMQLMKHKGAGKIIAIDIRQESLDHAKRFGADEVYLAHEVPDTYKVTDWDEIGQGIDVSVDTTGSPQGLALAGELAAVHGVLSIVGYHQSHQGIRNVNMQLWNWKALTVINAHERRNQVHVEAMKAMMTLMDNGRFHMKDMITHVHSLDEVDQAYEHIVTKPDDFIKSVIEIG
ncbi:alcohol dehydrogenase catalytic domain-containing protein [Gracilibacillus timonensis]|uniref:alcohol dehydrogenase catalytic domain-containing protein n=1 Tax=Gracilibacillus timonensis TaxID=1816696 RepID=UPI0008259351|nr:zinc-binding dehydrogenase [Gracilibacillus timonensis]